MDFDPDKLKSVDEIQDDQSVDQPVPEETAMSKGQIETRRDDLKEMEQEADARDKRADMEIRKELGIAGHNEHEHEHSHEEETQEKKDKLANDILARAENASAEVKKRAEMLAEQVRKDGSSSTESLRTDYSILAEKYGGTDDKYLQDVQRQYPGWQKPDFEELYGILYGENTRGETIKKEDNVDNDGLIKRGNRSSQEGDKEKNEAQDLKQLWQAEDYQKIFDNLVREKVVMRRQADCFSGTAYSADMLSKALGLDDFLNEDKKLKDIKEKLGVMHTLTEMREREIILEHLTPMLEVLPKAKLPSLESVGTKTEEDKAVEFLIKAGFCTAVGAGTQITNWSIGINIRGEELRGEIQEQFQRQKEYAAENAIQHGGVEERIVNGWMESGKTKLEYRPEQDQNNGKTEEIKPVQSKKNLFSRLFGRK